MKQSALNVTRIGFCIMVLVLIALIMCIVLNADQMAQPNAEQVIILNKTPQASEHVINAWVY
jgi:hypothetical protein